jgi:hypothetical protein
MNTKSFFHGEKREAAGLSAVLLSVFQTATPQKKFLTPPSKEHQISSLCLVYRKSSNVNLHVPLLSNLHVPLLSNLHVPLLSNLHVPLLSNLHVPLLSNLHVPLLSNLHIPLLSNLHVPLLSNLHVPLLSNILKINISLYVLKGERFFMPNYADTNKNSPKKD